jgi:1-aminocyclopropane-1-carboxylate deaminase/D-cysteine desulfhydrase-like pyridoxal-dependent ACC family enzyme
MTAGSSPSVPDGWRMRTLREAISRLPRYLLGHWPTPLEHLPRFSQALGGPQVFIKRDDCSGLAFGGNKTRHNEFLMADALRQKADMFVWGAGVQSNNCRQTAAACAKAGLGCHLVLGRGQVGGEPEPIQGNLLLDYLVGATVEIVDDGLGPSLDEKIAAAAGRYRERGHRVYFWDRHTVKPLAAISYAVCLAEIFEQSIELGIRPTAVYGSSAGSTGAGLVLGQQALGWGGLVRNVAPIEWPWDTRADVALIAQQAGDLIGISVEIGPRDVDISFEHITPGYGKVSPDGLDALNLLARTEGILLDPIYTAKAMAGLIADVRRGRWQQDEHLVFIHTGGTPALFAYQRDLVPSAN